MDYNIARRRKLRKGTSSCWECKRRKIRCVSSLASGAACIGCRRRGTNCVSQEFSEDDLPSPSEGGASQSGDRMANLGVVVQDLVRSVSNGSGTVFSDEFTANKHLTDLQPSFPQGQPSLAGSYTLAPPGPNKYIQFSRTLFEALPSQGDIDSIWSAGNCTSVHLIHHFRMTPEENDQVNYDDLKQKLLRRPGPGTHPVLMLAKFMQYLHPERFKSLDGLSLPPGALMRRLAETASSLSIENEDLLATVEGLECVIIEGTIQANLGNIQRAWLSFRRALNIAQIMGIHREVNHTPLNCIDSPSPTTKYRTMWFRIVYVDRFLSLMLGLPPGSPDYGIADSRTLAKETPLGQLSRAHFAAASRILERNDVALNGLDYEVTRSIDQRLKQVANSLPCKWWLTPDFAATQEHLVFQETLRVVEQIYHFNLLNQLYLPFMLHLQSDSAESSIRSQHTHAKHTCVNSSREVLNRFNALRNSSKITLCCRSVDFLGLMAAITLLLAHIDSHAQDGTHQFAGNIMFHQRLSDRALIGRMLEYMEDTAHWNADTLSQRRTDWVHELLAVEADAAAGKSYTIETPSLGDMLPTNSNGKEVVLISIAYFGLVRVSHRDRLRLQHRNQLEQATRPVETETDEILGNSASSDRTSAWLGLHPQPAPLGGDGTLQESRSQVETTIERTATQNEDQNFFSFALSSDTADFGDWTLQSGNRGFFDNFANGPSLDFIGNGNASQ
ncbi:hypothetical protein F4808DRAFT_444006 [Astrocystis sublimbata]|nr:hypothetical protein F4808DRAFT_444006 [Astrocystis sublimbata]